jgi:peptidase E
MTKFILHGGHTRIVNPDNNSFFKEITADTQDKALILLNYFSRDGNEVEQCASHDKRRILENSSNKELEFEVADINYFSDQIKRAQAIYVRGGDTKKLVAEMSKVHNLAGLFKDKTIAGSSAGLYFLTKYYWSNDRKQIEEGLGFFSIKAYCHYRPEENENIKQLLSYKEDLPLLTLPDFKYVVWFK